MCKLCETKPVYEFTNKRKLCKNCFINYFQRKILYTLKKFSMIKKEDIIGYKKENNFKSIVLEHALEFARERAGFQLIKLPGRANKIATDSSLDSEADSIIKILIKNNSSNLKSQLPTGKNVIKPLYLFLDEEILLYAKLKNLKFKKEEKSKDKFKTFEDDFERKHPEVKRAIVNSLLELYK